MRLWRIDRLAFPDKFSGFGAYRTPGRWHLRYNRVIYTSEVASLAALEYLAHLNPDTIPVDITLLEFEVPDDISIERLDTPETLNPDWRGIRFSPPLQNFGTQWLIERRTALLAVPSAILPIETNYLLNPAHPEIARVRIVGEEPFAYDPRLIKK
ncbi:MAG: RES domain-containing protein [Proteobacteria bacterium]|jgi:RES domain-containing protein|nr:RES domain-containing protein [Pseudomonadota bacterium]